MIRYVSGVAHPNGEVWESAITCIIIYMHINKGLPNGDIKTSQDWKFTLQKTDGVAKGHLYFQESRHLHATL